jgi:OOP family OmpA-OmpF porin
VSAFLKLGVVAGIGAFPYLCLQCANQTAPVIQQQIQSSVWAALREGQFRGITVGGDGRRIILTGTVSLESAKRSAIKIAAAQPGVASVDDRLAVSGGASEVQLRVRMILAQRKIVFEPGETELADPSQPVLQDLRAALLDAPNANIQVEGYTDDSGDEDKNRAISQKRAQAILNWLADHGIPRGRLQAIGYGPDRPLAPNDTVEGRARNRRIEITLAEH